MDTGCEAGDCTFPTIGLFTRNKNQSEALHERKYPLDQCRSWRTPKVRLKQNYHILRWAKQLISWYFTEE